MNVPDQLPPHDHDGEQATLGTIVESPECFDDCATVLKAGSLEFYDLRHRVIYEAISALRSRAEPVCLLSLMQQLKADGKLDQVGGVAYLTELEKWGMGPSNISYAFAGVHEAYLRRQVITLCVKTQRAAMNGGPEAITLAGELQTALALIESSDARTSDGKACVLGFTDDLERRRTLHEAGEHSGILTGFYRLDQMTDGLQFGELAVIAARPSIGKTAFALDVVRRACLCDKIPTVFVTLEMSRDALMRRMFAATCEVDLSSIRRGLFTTGQYDAYQGFCGLVRERPIYIEDGVSKPLTISVLAAKVRRLVRKFGVRLVIVDYLQKIKPDRSNEKKTYEVAQASEGLVALARETKAAVLSIASLNREGEKEKGRAPRISDLAHCGQIEFDADFIGLLHRPKDPKESMNAKFYVAKQRDGEVDVFPLTFCGKYCRFENPSRDQSSEQHD